MTTRHLDENWVAALEGLCLAAHTPCGARRWYLRRCGSDRAPDDRVRGAKAANWLGKHQRHAALSLGRRQQTQPWIAFCSVDYFDQGMVAAHNSKRHTILHGSIDSVHSLDSSAPSSGASIGFVTFVVDGSYATNARRRHQWNQNECLVAQNVCATSSHGPT